MSGESAFFFESLVFAVISIGLIQNLAQMVQVCLAARALTSRPPELNLEALWRRYADAAPKVSILAPAYNEEATIVAAVSALLTLRYPSYEVIVVNDGSLDQTLAILIEAFGLVPVRRRASTTLATEAVRATYATALHPRLLVIDKANGGKADALNAGINAATAPLFCAIDADSLLEPDALFHAVQPFLERPHEVVAVGGAVRVANGCRVDRGAIVEAAPPRRIVPLLQAVEYTRAFLLARLGMASIGALTIISGAFGVFRRGAVLEVGGYLRGTVGEDMELVLRLQKYCRERRHRFGIAFVLHPTCWTEAPESLQVLSRQRRRWQRGALETFRRHGGMMFNPRYGRVGALGLGMVLITDVLGPMAELSGYLLIPWLYVGGSLSLPYLVAYWALGFSFGLGLTVVALGLEDSDLRRIRRTSDLARLLFAAVIEGLGYRQLNALWRVQGLFDWIRSRRDWGVITRKGFQSAA